jgi:peptidoglycan/LPS O-acetylase OafA/YrhL
VNLARGGHRHGLIVQTLPAALQGSTERKRLRNYRIKGMETNLKRHVPELDGLRGFAILAVILGHNMGLPASRAVERILSGATSLSWTGVDLFFVLSGFLIGGILLDARGASNYFQVFYARRFFRIFPIYYIWLVLYVLLLTFGRSFLRAHVASGVVPALDFETWSHFLYLQNFLAGGYVAIADWCVGVTWSLAVEEQFYLIAPVAVRFLNRRTLSWALVGTVLLAPLIRLFVRSEFENGPDLGYTLMFCRADALALGMLAALVVREENWKKKILANLKMLEIVSGILAVGMIGIWIWAKNPRLLSAQSFGYTWIAFFYVSILLLAITSPAGLIARLSRVPWLRELGRVSYCMYIIHRPIQIGLSMLITRRPPGLFNVVDIAMLAGGLALTYGVARISWVLLEYPLRTIGHRWSYGDHIDIRSPALGLRPNA